MRGDRWESVKASYRKCLIDLMKMQSIIVTTFTYDDNVYPHVNMKSPSEALKEFEKLPFNKGEDTVYDNAMETIASTIEDMQGEYENYCTFVLFLSDGMAEFPRVPVNKMIELKRKGRKIVFYTIACVADDDSTMVKMSKEIGGEHYKIAKPENSKFVFTRVLGA